jgi:hypothetical protein
MLRACPTLGLLCAPAPIPKPTPFPVRSFVLPAAATTGLPLMLFGDMPDECDGGILLGLSVREVRTYDRGVMFTFRSPSLLLLLLLLLVVSATFTCGNRGRVVVVGALALMVGVRPAVVEGVALAATRGVSGPPVRLVARVGFTGGGRPGALRSDDIAGLRGYRDEYIEGRSVREVDSAYR